MASVALAEDVIEAAQLAARASLDVRGQSRALAGRMDRVERAVSPYGKDLPRLVQEVSALKAQGAAALDALQRQRLAQGEGRVTHQASPPRQMPANSIIAYTGALQDTELHPEPLTIDDAKTLCLSTAYVGFTLSRLDAQQAATEAVPIRFATTWRLQTDPMSVSYGRGTLPCGCGETHCVPGERVWSCCGGRSEFGECLSSAHGGHWGQYKFHSTTGGGCGGGALQRAVHSPPPASIQSRQSSQQQSAQQSSQAPTELSTPHTATASAMPSQASQAISAAGGDTAAGSILSESLSASMKALTKSLSDVGVEEEGGGGEEEEEEALSFVSDDIERSLSLKDPPISAVSRSVSAPRESAVVSYVPSATEGNSPAATEPNVAAFDTAVPTSSGGGGGVRAVSSVPRSASGSAEPAAASRLSYSATPPGSPPRPPSFVSVDREWEDNISRIKDELSVKSCMTPHPTVQSLSRAPASVPSLKPSTEGIVKVRTSGGVFTNPSNPHPSNPSNPSAPRPLHTTPPSREESAHSPPIRDAAFGEHTATAPNADNAMLWRGGSKGAETHWKSRTTRGAAHTPLATEDEVNAILWQELQRAGVDTTELAVDLAARLGDPALRQRSWPQAQPAPQRLLVQPETPQATPLPRSPHHHKNRRDEISLTSTSPPPTPPKTAYSTKNRVLSRTIVVAINVNETTTERRRRNMLALREDTERGLFVEGLTTALNLPFGSIRCVEWTPSLRVAFVSNSMPNAELLASGFIARGASGGVRVENGPLSVYGTILALQDHSAPQNTTQPKRPRASIPPAPREAFRSSRPYADYSTSGRVRSYSPDGESVVPLHEAGDAGMPRIGVAPLPASPASPVQTRGDYEHSPFPVSRPRGTPQATPLAQPRVCPRRLSPERGRGGGGGGGFLFSRADYTKDSGNINIARGMLGMG